MFSMAITLATFSQDIIVTNDGNEIEAKVIEISDDVIKYKAYNFQDGPMRNIAISEVFLIIYENGERERFAAEEQRKRMVPALLGFNIPRKTKDRNGKGHRHLSLTVGGCEGAKTLDFENSARTTFVRSIVG